jgi:hypothetical protein
MKKLLALFTLSVVGLWAQIGTGSIRGAVTDPSGAVVAGATVTLTNTGTGGANKLTTDTDGRYVAPGLAVGRYTIQAQAEGFETAVVENINLAVGDQREANITLAVGQMTQSVAVQDQAAQVDSASSTVSGLIGQEQMRELPLNGRNFEQLIVLTPGVVPVTNAASSAYIGRSQVYSFAGARPVGQEEQIDGQDIQNFWDRGSGAAVLGTSLGVDSIAEFRTYTSTASAQFGGANGGVNAVTHSGTNALHGTAYYFVRRDVFDANPYFVPATGKPPFSRDQFGGTGGGAIKKNKMFFFANYEGLRQTLGELPALVMPNQAARTEATNYLNSLPVGSAQRSAEQIVVNALNAVPLPPAGSIDLGNGTSQTIQSGTQSGTEHYIVGRYDYTINNKDAIFYRIIYDHATLAEPFAANTAALYPQTAFDHNQFHALGWTRNVSPNMVNQAQFNFTRTVQVGGVSNSIPAFNCNPQNAYDCYFNVPGIGSLFGLNTPTAPIFDYVQNKFEPRDQVTWVHGGHSVAFGGFLQRNQTATNTPVNPGGQYAFSSFGYSASGTPLANSFLSGVPTSFTGALPGQADSNRDFREIDIATYIQDDWKIRKSLTINAGLRYAYETNPIERLNRIQAFVHPLTNIDTGYTVVPHPFLHNPSTKNFDPRLGLAWSPFRDNKTVFRAAAGILHDLYQPRSYGVGLNFSPPFNQVTVPFPALTMPIQFKCVAAASQCTAPLPSIHDALGYDIPSTPYIIQFSANVQRELPGAWMVSVGYIGSQSSHLLTQVGLNPPIASGTPDNPVFATVQGGLLVTNPRINPNFGDMGQIMPWAHASYNAVQFQANKSLTHGLQVQTNYTFSHCFDSGSATYSVDNAGSVAPLIPYPLSRNAGACGFDRKHNLSANAVYLLPFKSNRLVEGWQLSNIFGFHTGLPFTVACGFDCLGLNQQNSSNFVNVNPGVDLNSVVQPGNINQYFNPNLFSLQPLGTLGNEIRNSFYGPSLVNDDLSVSKTTKIRERLSVQIRAEAFNLFNHPNFSNPNTSLYTGPTTKNPSVGKITGTISASGGLPSSRQIQFAVRLAF